MDNRTFNSFLTSNFSTYKVQLARLVSIPSVSADPVHADDLGAVLQEIAGICKEIGFQTKIMVSQRHHPILIATRETKKNAPWLLVYNHLDVQPANEPEWKSDPFKPVITSKKIIGRGATDDKGPALSVIYAIKYLAEQNLLHCNLQICYETAEEIGSIGFAKFLRSSKELQKPSLILISDTIFEGKNPAITCSLRGLVKFDIVVKTARAQIHSGIGGGAVVNPIHILSSIISRCIDHATG